MIMKYSTEFKHLLLKTNLNIHVPFQHNFLLLFLDLAKWRSGPYSVAQQ